MLCEGFVDGYWCARGPVNALAKRTHWYPCFREVLRQRGVRLQLTSPPLPTVPPLPFYLFPPSPSTS